MPISERKKEIKRRRHRKEKLAQYEARLKKGADKKMSFSKMTFPHRLARILLLEQLFRGFKIINNETYHK